MVTRSLVAILSVSLAVSACNTFDVNPCDKYWVTRAKAVDACLQSPRCYVTPQDIANAAFTKSQRPECFAPARGPE